MRTTPRFRRSAAVMVAAVTALGLAACSSTDTPATADEATAGSDDTLVIGSMLWNASVPFYSNFIKGQEEAADELGVTLKMVDGKGDLGAQVAGVQQLVTQGVDAILVTASDAKGISPAVKQAVAAGIPVFAVNNRVDDAAGAVTFIGADDVEFGRQQAHLLVEQVGEDADVAYMAGALGTSAQLLRQQGFDEVLADYPGIRVVDTQTNNWDAAEALTVVQDWLNKYPEGSLDAVVAQGPETANAAKYASDRGRTDIRFILGDFPVEVREGILAGYVAGSVNQDPYPQGTRSVEAAVQWLTGEKDKVTQPNEYLPLPIVTKANVEDHAAAWGE
ncbi:sugar ABC transporter substrate-binding protein [Cellulomonas dongxiuzhuiae]|uniref:Sugar ABC transporter substrate-binding protein n=1 Tax=Cellulomonas dongxiuzhuiae TaxID=2819979 RepID=A0ABX8GLZ7_9CELL|nr:sugar ABC transporter substrate-binding protein [Cellulomonas dongxiuzhuiae]MBO3089814.1 sugar ABC transporter substrate-binding protein [Cellulomonas dongxiuzhuiae]MBO3095582.1 sugar ABC transporter substrate-binding protein [Cellulomonas dongxiuzhuiae]QWC16551.1 sugar ABC transporter substrate-binding protein [Cellulomonas dongxiuzhuiae]